MFRSLISGSVIEGPDLGKLRSAVIERLGVEDAIICGSGSLALEIALRACGVREGDEVDYSHLLLHQCRTAHFRGRRAPRARGHR